MMVLGHYWLVPGVTGSVRSGTGLYLVVLEQYRAVRLIRKGEVSTIRFGMLESSGFRKYSTLLVIQLFSRRLCLCHTSYLSHAVPV